MDARGIPRKGHREGFMKHARPVVRWSVLLGLVAGGAARADCPVLPVPPDQSRCEDPSGTTRFVLSSTGADSCRWAVLIGRTTANGTYQARLGDAAACETYLDVRSAGPVTVAVQRTAFAGADPACAYQDTVYLSVTPGPALPYAQHYGNSNAERAGTHDANRIRTTFWNYGMVGDYPPDPGKVDLSVFHSVEVPKGSGMNYTDGITPFVMARIAQAGGDTSVIMETGFRERQGISPRYNRIMRFEPVPGYFNDDASVNLGRSPAISSDRRTWPHAWPEKRFDTDDPGWMGNAREDVKQKAPAQWWDGYFGKRAAADEESFTVMDDNFYDAWDYSPNTCVVGDSARFGLGLRVEVRGFQWSNPQAGNVIFWHYDITNESTTDYDDNIIFGLYMDSGVGGSALSCDGIYESDDDNAYFDRSSGLNLVYTWDTGRNGVGHGVDLSGNCGLTGYLGYAYMETPGNPYDGVDNDQDGITDERRDSGPGIRIDGQDAIRAWVTQHYDLAKFEAFYGPLANRPAYRAGVWFTGDENLNWTAEFDDVGADGLPGTHDTGEGDGIPTDGEPHFDRTDKDESDQIGLTGFKMNRIKAGAGNPNPITDDILFYDQAKHWPTQLWEHFTAANPANRFDDAVAANYNIGFLFASGPFKLPAGKHERFSLALAYGEDLAELRETVRTVQLIYNANYQFAVPPPAPTVTAEAGDGRVRLSWDDVAERGVDPVTNEFDFEGYRIYRATDPEFRDPQVVATGSNSLWLPNGKPIAQFDLKDGKKGYSRKVIRGIGYYLGEDSGLTHTWTDTTVTNGQEYYYAVCAYDYGYDPGSDSLAIFPSENAITVSRTPRGGTILPRNVVVVRPEPRVPGYLQATPGEPEKVAGDGTGTARLEVVNSGLVPDHHLFRLDFLTDFPDSIHATWYELRDSSTQTTLFSKGTDFDGLGIGPAASGLLPIVRTQPVSYVDSLASGFRAGASTNARFNAYYLGALSQNRRRLGYPDDIRIVFEDAYVDTGLTWGPPPITTLAKFHVYAHPCDTCYVRLPFRFRDYNRNGTLDTLFFSSGGTQTGDFIEVISPGPAVQVDSLVTWRVQLDPRGPHGRPDMHAPAAGDTFDLKIVRPLNVSDVFIFAPDTQRVDPAMARAGFDRRPYVVPNPYIGSASFEPARFAVSGRGERRVEFRNLPQGCTIRIYTVRGDLVRTLRQDGSLAGFVAWDLRTKDNLDVAPGLYIYNVDAPGTGEFTGKLGVIK